MATAMPMTLEEQLRARAEAAAQKRPADVAEVYDAGIAAVRDSGLAEQVLRVGEQVPDFTLPDTSGRPVTLSDVVRSGPCIVTFFRGGWCPYCNLELRAYQAMLPELDAAGVGVLAIGPQRVDVSTRTAEDNSLGFPVLSDVGNIVAATFRIVHPLAPDVRAIYERSGHDLATGATPEDDGGYVTLPLPATFLVDSGRTVRFAFASPDYTERAEPSAVLALARTLTR